MSSTDVPPITQALRDAGLQQPGGWVYAIDPAFDPAGEVPPFAIIGAWRVDGHGRVTDEFRANSSYIKSPTARGWRSAKTHLEMTLQQAAVGALPNEAVRLAFDEAVVWVYSRHDDDALHVADVGAGVQAVFAFSDHDLAVASGWAENRSIDGAELRRIISPATRIVVNSGSEVIANITADSVVTAEVPSSNR